MKNTGFEEIEYDEEQEMAAYRIQVGFKNRASIKA